FGLFWPWLPLWWWPLWPWAPSWRWPWLESASADAVTKTAAASISDPSTRANVARTEFCRLNEDIECIKFSFIDSLGLVWFSACLQQQARRRVGGHSLR